jgi:hypothetical protein
MDVVMRAMEWMKENDPDAYYEALAHFECGNQGDLEEIIAGCPDSVTGRVPAGGDGVDEEQYERR